MTGLLLAGIGVSPTPINKPRLSSRLYVYSGEPLLTPVQQHITTGAEAQKNFLVVDSKTETAAIESAFDSFTERKDIGIVLINQHVSLSGGP